MARIALDATYTIEREPSGIAVYSRRLIESLAEVECDHEFMLCYRLSRFRRRREFLHPASSAQGPKFSTRLFHDGLTFWLPYQARLFHSLAQRPPAFRFEKEIVTIHDVFPLTGRGYSSPDYLAKFSALLLEAVRRADRLISPSQYTSDQLVRHTGVNPDRISIVPEGVNLPAQTFTPAERARERARLVGEGYEMILNVGVLQNRKNILNMLTALEKLPARYRLVLAGGDGYGCEAIHDRLRRQDLASRVTRMGHVSARQLPAVYQAASVMLFPSFEEGFGLPVLEAMANGLPVVISNTSSLPEVGGDAAIYVDPHDPDQMAAKVSELVENESLRNEMVWRGLARAREFSWRRAAEATVAIYDEVLGLRSPR